MQWVGPDADNSLSNFVENAALQIAATANYFPFPALPFLEIWMI